MEFGMKTRRKTGNAALMHIREQCSARPLTFTRGDMECGDQQNTNWTLPAKDTSRNLLHFLTSVLLHQFDGNKMSEVIFMYQIWLHSR